MDAPLRIGPAVLQGQAKDQVGDFIPPGTIVHYGSTTPPNGWLLCDGSSKLRTDYPRLFDVIGTSFGTGSGSNTFSLPAGGRVIVGWQSGLVGVTGGTSTHTHLNHAEHKHGLPFSFGAQAIRWSESQGSNPYGTHTSATSRDRMAVGSLDTASMGYGMTTGVKGDAGASGLLGHDSQSHLPPFVRIPMIIKY